MTKTHLLYLVSQLYRVFFTRVKTDRNTMPIFLTLNYHEKRDKFLKNSDVAVSPASEPRIIFFRCTFETWYLLSHFICYFVLIALFALITHRLYNLYNCEFGTFRPILALCWYIDFKQIAYAWWDTETNVDPYSELLKLMWCDCVDCVAFKCSYFFHFYCVPCIRIHSKYI